MRFSLSVTFMLICILCTHNAHGAGPDIDWHARLMTTTAISGVPVVVSITAKNNANESRQVRSQRVFGSWGMTCVWRSGDAIVPIRLSDLLQKRLAVSNPTSPPMVMLEAGSEVNWHFAVPTPPRFGKEAEWGLEISTKTGLQESKTFLIKVDGKDSQQRETINALTPSLAQSAIFSTYFREAFQEIEQKQLWQTVVDLAENGECVAQLIVFSKSLSDQKGIVDAWRQLDQCDPEVRCLRNFLYVERSRHGGNLAREDRRTIAGLLQPGDWFEKEIRALRN